MNVAMTRSHSTIVNRDAEWFTDDVARSHSRYGEARRLITYTHPNTDGTLFMQYRKSLIKVVIPINASFK